MRIEKISSDVVEPGTYSARVVEVTQVESKFGPQFQWLFRLESGVEVPGWVEPKLGEQTKLGGWVRAVRGEVPDTLDTETLVNRECRVVVGVKTRTDGTEYNRVEAVLPPQPRQGELPSSGAQSGTCMECGAPADGHTPDGQGWCSEHAPVERPFLAVVGGGGVPTSPRSTRKDGRQDEPRYRWCGGSRGPDAGPSAGGTWPGCWEPADCPSRRGPLFRKRARETRAYETGGDMGG